MVSFWRCVVVLVLGVNCAHAQAPQAPYKPVQVTLTAVPNDKSLVAFRAQLAAIAQRKDRAALAKLVVTKDFFWEGNFGGMFDAKKSGFDNLTAALRLNEADGRGWTALAAFAAETTMGSTVEHDNAHCAPEAPDYEDAELAALMEKTGTDVGDWNYPRQKGLAVRGAAAADAPTIETLPLALVRVLGSDRSGWTRIATPGGKIGYVAPGTLLSPLANRLCFGKEAGAWRIIGYAGAGD